MMIRLRDAVASVNVNTTCVMVDSLAALVSLVRSKRRLDSNR